MIELNPNSPSPKSTEFLQKAGLQIGVKYITKWSDGSVKDWDFCVEGQCVASLPVELIQKMIQLKIFLSKME